MKLKEVFLKFSEAINLIDIENRQDYWDPAESWEEVNRAAATIFWMLSPDERKELLTKEMVESYPRSLLAAIVKEQSSRENVTVVGAGEEPDLNK